MKTVRNIIWAMIATMSAFWFAMEPQLFASNNVFEWRSAMIQYSGILSLMLMSITMVLAMRLPMVENWLKGMDKAYRVHKWLGIGGVALGVTHWLWYQIPKSLVTFGILAKPVRHDGSGPQAVLTGWEIWVNELRDIAQSIGEWGFYLLLVLLVASLWAAVKYKPFKLSHRLMSVAYLFIAFHSVILLKRAYRGEPIYYLTVAFALVGSIAAIYSLLGLIGRRNRHSATIASTRYFPQAEVMELVLKPDASWQGHKAGQFAYLRFGNEDPHPFTIVSGSEDSELRFLIKELGDFTNGLYERVKAGDTVRVEGPYGRLEFDLSKPQIWVAGGVGIASFFATLEALKSEPDHPRIELFYCTRGIDDHLVDELLGLAHEVGVKLNVIDTLHSPRLNAGLIANQCGDLNDYELYFCGPELFSTSLKKELDAYQFDIEKHYHEELFVMR
ncbi:Ferric reductase [Vibrio chagasii]|uniref:ferredoxin reductase family protein n=1 Tax=Vibrio TaxID=662 RepID=UPI000E32C257|nr:MULTISPECIES: ferric reductase-like transmembrane domain-containing protein [Vibrio]MDE9380744.1 ferric reductase-like transmembrane domain-containing protein [Vibrio alginolyticus]MCG9607273.1 ferric reductase-like transmembrane domain-containing protein [Vibrio chagasii]CAH6910108.1 Ferric reductase [Vibrio chagasii]CAH7027624.1 Ferric reductase [Vibrio chagasii]CAH7045989.1 Ferric reductase [Vibrio chagasii]